MDYDPAPHLSRIKAPVLAINFADDELNPPEVGILERAIGQLSNGRLVLVPATERSRGHHYTALQAAQWKCYLSDVIKLTAG